MRIGSARLHVEVPTAWIVVPSAILIAIGAATIYDDLPHGPEASAPSSAPPSPGNPHDPCALALPGTAGPTGAEIRYTPPGPAKVRIGAAACLQMLDPAPNAFTTLTDLMPGTETILDCIVSAPDDPKYATIFKAETPKPNRIVGNIQVTGVGRPVGVGNC